MIGTLGSNIVFQVSDSYALTFNGMTRDVTSRWSVHETPGIKPKPEFLGPGLQTISLPITLSASLGVRATDLWAPTASGSLGRARHGT